MALKCSETKLEASFNKDTMRDCGPTNCPNCSNALITPAVADDSEKMDVPWNVVVKSGKPNRDSTKHRRAVAKKSKTVNINMIEEDGADVANCSTPTKAERSWNL